MTPGTIKYRPDIDGLRALAIISVVVYHYFPTLAPGGFTGVDIFFVISGFLISSIILDQIKDGSFRFGDFYARRIRRIFPALTLVLASMLVAGWFTLFWDEYQQLGQHVAYGVGFISNIALWRESGYFDKANDVKPLLHLWSLGIEEQFYILWPLVLFLLSKFRFVKPSIVIALLFFASLAYAAVTIQSDSVQAFYSPLARSWELMAGAFLALLPGGFGKISTPLKNISSCAGIVALLFGFFALNDQMQFPGFWALFPVLGTGLLLLSGEAHINRHVLSNRLMVFIGHISFPLYLWHWPILTFYRILSGGDMTNAYKLALLAVACLLAVATYLGVEKKIRFNASLHYVVPSLCLSMLILGIMGHLVYKHGGYHDRTATRQWQQFLETVKPYDQIVADHHAIGCNQQNILDMSSVVKTGLNYCQMSTRSGMPDSVLIGDSHAGDKFFGFADNDLNRKWMLLGNSACPLFWSLQAQAFPPDDPTSISEAALCRGKFNQIIKFVVAAPTIKLVVLAFGNPMDKLNILFDPPKQYRAFQADGGLSKYDIAYRVLDATITTLEKTGKRVVFLRDPPHLGVEPRDCLRRHNTEQCEVPLENVLRRQQANQTTLLTNLQAKHPDMVIVDPTPFFCGEKSCQFMEGDKIWYEDDHHLSFEGSDYFAKHVLPLLPQ